METHKLYICNKINNLIVLRLTFVLQMFIFYNIDSVLTKASVPFRKSSSASWPLTFDSVKPPETGGFGHKEPQLTCS